MNTKFYEILGKMVMALVGFLAIVAVGALLTGFPLMWLWNWLMPMLFGLKVLTFWQAWGVSVLCSILFKSSTTNKSE